MTRLVTFFAITIAALELLPHAIGVAAVLGIIAAALLLRKDGGDYHDQ